MPSPSRLPPDLRERLPDLAPVLSDDEIARLWDISPVSVARTRARLALPNWRGWPAPDARLRALVVDHRLTDDQIAARFDVTPRAVAERRREIGLRRPHDPRVHARGEILVPPAPSAPTPIQAALAALGPRVVEGREGYRLDGAKTPITVILRLGNPMG